MSLAPEPLVVDRFAAAHYAPPQIPVEVLRHTGVPQTLGVGRPGKVGLLELGFEVVGPRTELVRHYQKSPLQIMRPLHVDPGRPDLAVVYLMSTGGGIVQADRLRTDVVCGADTAVHLTTQAATKVHRADADFATQQVNLTVGAGGYLEHLPDPVIPFAGARLHQRTVVTVDPTATVLLSDTLVGGRLARGECHAYDVVATDLEVRRPDGQLLAVDTVRLEPGRADVRGPGVLAGHMLMASFYVVSPLAPATDIADVLHAALAEHPVQHGVSVLPQDSGAWARVLGSDPPAVAAAMAAAWDAVRRCLIGVPAPPLRKV
ncbi:urease accessory protein UreD [Rhodococcus sp. X156]|uniref:urease accessory protein UreD n=1 Tax=Rhodococcus sp. X156 TaxID=2499145 RepID=UPI001F49E5AC|nr:urease accessory protein UreD [Rhodococcus sp. X156]